MMHCFVTPWTAVVTFSARPAAAGLRCAPPLLLARRPQGRSRNFTTAWPQRELLRSPGGVPEIARVFPEQYESLLNEKVELLESLLADAVTHHDEDESLPPIEVFRSPSINFRMRASFQVWRDGVDPDATRHFVMYNRDDKVMPREVLSYPMGSLRINALMAPTLEAISASEVLQRKVRQRGQSAPLAAPQLASCASSGRAWWLWARRALSGAEGSPPGAQPVPRVCFRQPPPRPPIAAAVEPAGRLPVRRPSEEGRRPEAGVWGTQARHHGHLRQRQVGARRADDARHPPRRRPRRRGGGRGRARPQPAGGQLAGWRPIRAIDVERE